MSIDINVTIASEVNYVLFHQNRQELVGQITLSGVSGDSLVCRVTSFPEFIYENKREVKVTGTSVVLPKPELKMNDHLFRHELIEAKEGEIRIEVYHPDHPEHILGFKNETVHIQPYLHWTSKYPESVAGFLQPNDPLVQSVLKRAGEYAQAEGRTLCGYQCQSKEEVIKQAEYIFRALQDAGIHYISAPASFELRGQKLRIPHQVLHEKSKQGTCLDLAVLYATCLEAVSLNAMIIFIPGHAFSGVWTERKMLKKPLVHPSEVDPEEWKRELESFHPVECTAFTDGKEISFSSAVTIAKGNVDRCSFVVDVECARYNGLNPVFTYTDEPICTEHQEMLLSEEFTKRERTKIEILRDQAMDITVKNTLLNGEEQKLSLAFELQSESFFKGKVGEKDILSSVKNHQLLGDLYRNARHTEKETGKRDLYICLDELHWCQPYSDKYMKAVLYLCPIEIYRNGRGDYLVRFNYEEAFLNPALKVLMVQRFQLDSEKILRHPGHQYKEQIELIRFLIANQKGWKVIENTARIGMYHIPNEDIWNNLHDEAVLSHEIVHGVINGEMDWDNRADCKEEETDSVKVYPYETDSSQEAIIESAFKKKAQVVPGSAGNGKTQTEVNLIFEALRRNEKVLFVSEKAPALEMARKRLDEVLNGLFRLHIAPGKDRPDDIIRQIRKNLEHLERDNRVAAPENMEELKTKIVNATEYLEKYYSLMSKKSDNCKMSLDELFDFYEKYSDSTLNFMLDDLFARISLSDAEEQVGILAKVVEEYEDTKGEYDFYLKHDHHGEEEETACHEAAQLALQRYEKIAESTDQLRECLKLETLESEKKQMQQMIRYGNVLRKCPVFNENIRTILDDSNRDCDFQLDLVDELDKLNKSLPAFMMKKQREKCAAMLRKIFSAREADRILSEFDENQEAVFAYIENMKIITDNEGRLVLFGEERKEELLAYLDTVDALLVDESDEVAGRIDAAVGLIVEGKGSKILDASIRVYEDYKRYSSAQKAAEELLVRNADEFARNYPDLPKKVLFEEWIKIEKMDTGKNDSIYYSIVAEMKKNGYGNLISQLEEYKRRMPINRKEIMDGFYKSWALYQIDKILETMTGENQFNHIIFQDKVQQLDQKEMDLRSNLKQELLAVLIGRMPNIQEGVSKNPEFGTLQKMVRKKNVTVRSIFETVPNMLSEICPCMIMTPADVAKYIPSGFPAFDLVLIDEGSQMPTYNALIPISRGKRCMIFGDEKQMQPADEFKARVESESEVVAGPESILTSAYITSMPRKILRFHYRSEDDSLIAFSNKTYYNGDLITFPSNEINHNAVQYEFVEDGMYDRELKVNTREAECVVNRIRSLYEDLTADTEQTLGVITFNIYQRNYIQKLLLEAVGEDSDLGRKIEERITIMNLESCQGQEWDTVLISPGFGYDQNGKFHTGFGALNREYGENRLNVMLTRARKKMIVITSIDPYMLKDARSEGVQNFREFLRYAKGEIILDSRSMDRSTRANGLVNQVANALEAKGYEVHTNIGSSEFKVDLGIVSKDDPSRYELGILLDHFNDVRGSIHDREIIYPKILKKKGWNVYRLSKLNWNNSPEREIRQIMRKLNKK